MAHLQPQPRTSQDLLPVSLCSWVSQGACSLPSSPRAAPRSGQPGLQDGVNWVGRSQETLPLKEKRLLDVKLGELPSWILMRDFTPRGIAGAFQRGYYRYYNKYVNVKKGSVAGLSMVLAAYVLFNYCRCYKELKHERLRKYH
ncbi:ATP synthase subunit f; mitochondrial [Camelus dromedarius]|uniref:ATP synthase F(0) complex subunit f, mitochondrial n=1 Tax=Camelus dromedarius TaxID=9838 RepID=A0A5N4CWE6_CAMDR|nr:ATP synthase subunit f; mitochondrial [Camelus dromedarius]